MVLGEMVDLRQWKDSGSPSCGAAARAVGQEPAPELSGCCCLDCTVQSCPAAGDIWHFRVLCGVRQDAPLSIALAGPVAF